MHSQLAVCVALGLALLAQLLGVHGAAGRLAACGRLLLQTDNTA